jgi:hypothetical protein
MRVLLNLFLFIAYVLGGKVVTDVVAVAAHLAGSVVVGDANGFRCQKDTCARYFASASGLGRHYQTSKHVRRTRVPFKRRGRRHVYSFTRKRNLILELDGLRSDKNILFPAKHLANLHNIDASLISTWNSNRAEIFLRARTPGMAKMQKYRPSIAKYPEAEVELYGRFVWRRTYLRLATHRDWLRDNMSQILRRDNITNSVPSRSWCSKFCKRWEITSQCRTNKHKLSVQERLPAIRKFHSWLIYGLQRSAPERCPKYGRFPPELMYHMDQVPCARAPSLLGPRGP